MWKHNANPKDTPTTFLNAARTKEKAGQNRVQNQG